MNDGVTSGAVTSTKFVESFNALTGKLSLMKRDKNDGVLSETLHINCKDMTPTDFVVEAYDECEHASIDAPYMADLTIPLGYSL